MKYDGNVNLILLRDAITTTSGLWNGLSVEAPLDVDEDVGIVSDAAEQRSA